MTVRELDREVRVVKLGLGKGTEGYIFTEVEVIVNKDRRLTLDTDVLQSWKRIAVEMYCTDTGAPTLPEDWEAYTVVFKCRDIDGDLMVIRSNRDLCIMLWRILKYQCLKVQAIVTPPSVEQPAKRPKNR